MIGSWKTSGLMKLRIGSISLNFSCDLKKLTFSSYTLSILFFSFSAQLAQSDGWGVMVSHRSGETEE